MKPNKEVTIHDLAAELNVAPSTVSRALKEHPSISKETIQLVKKLAQERGYRPNQIAASLRNSKTNTIGVIISLINRPFVSSLISGIEDTARQEGYNVLISQSHDSYYHEVANAKALYNSRVSGLIVSLATETLQYDHFQEFFRSNIPVVFVDQVPEEVASHRVIIDNFAAGFMATEHLIAQGCKRIAHFVGSQHRNVYKERFRGYREALQKHHLPIEEELIISGNSLSLEEGTKLANQLFSLPNPPDGLFCPNDTTAISAIQCAKKRGIKVPEQLAIIGFNNDPISSIIDPPLSTITHPAVEMGKIAAQQLLKHSKHKEKNSHETVVLKTELLVRESSQRTV
jgi:LacI family transcriptional regulator